MEAKNKNKKKSAPDNTILIYIRMLRGKLDNVVIVGVAIQNGGIASCPGTGDVSTISNPGRSSGSPPKQLERQASMNEWKDIIFFTDYLEVVD